MLDIMKAIYDMMGKCTYPVLKEDAPRQHVETFFQVGIQMKCDRKNRIKSDSAMGRAPSFYGGEAHLATLWDYSRLCAQISVLEGSGDHIAC